jgi:hypothetical protein
MEELVVLRPVLEGVVTYTEVSTILSLNDVIKINDLLDMKADIEKQAYEQKQ